MDNQPSTGRNQQAMATPTNNMSMGTPQPGNIPQQPQFSGNQLLANKKLLYGLIAGAVGIVLLIIIIIIVVVQSAPPTRKDLQDAQMLIQTHSRTETQLLRPFSRSQMIDTKALINNRKELISKLGSSRAIHDKDIKLAYETYKRETDRLATALDKLPSYYPAVITFAKDCADSSALSRQNKELMFRNSDGSIRADSDIEKDFNKVYGSCVDQAKKLQSVNDNDGARKVGTEYTKYYQEVKSFHLKAAQYYRTHSDENDRVKYNWRSKATPSILPPTYPNDHGSNIIRLRVIDDSILLKHRDGLSEMSKLLDSKMTVYRAA